jgi:hypothetical protein
MIKTNKIFIVIFADMDHYQIISIKINEQYL